MSPLSGGASPELVVARYRRNLLLTAPVTVVLLAVIWFATTAALGPLHLVVNLGIIVFLVLMHVFAYFVLANWVGRAHAESVELS